VRLRLRDRAFRRGLRPGRYVVEVALGRDRGTAGPAAARPLPVTR
jgi:hypothetical protein